VARRRPSRSQLALRWLGVLVLVAIAAAYVNPLRSYAHAKDGVRVKRAEVARLAHEKKMLTRRLQLAGTDTFIERQARELGLVQPGEHLYIVSGVDSWQKRAGDGAETAIR